MTEPALDVLRAEADAADRLPEWPAASLDALAGSGAARAAVPAEYGGTDTSAPEHLRLAHRAASACLTTAFIWSQRESAVRRLLSAPPELQHRWLPRLARGEILATVGISQLTTSRQHGAPALRAIPDGDGWKFDGTAPWVTGADRADLLVVGATLENNEQILAAVSRPREGLSAKPPMPLGALLGSRTAEVVFAGVRVGRDEVVLGPQPSVLGTVGGGGLETSAIALGLADAAISSLEGEATKRADLLDPANNLRREHDELLQTLLTYSAGSPCSEDVLGARTHATQLALRATQADLVAAKGAGFVAPHPAGRRARQALFLLVWSCPRPVAAGVLAELAS